MLYRIEAVIDMVSHDGPERRKEVRTTNSEFSMRGLVTELVAMGPKLKELHVTVVE